MLKSYDSYRIKIYSPVKALRALSDRKIKVYDFRKVEDYTYEFKVNPKYKKEIIEIFSEAVLIERHGPKAIAFNLIKKKTTVISFIFSLILFIFASTRIYNIEIVGESKNIDQEIIRLLDENNIARYKSIPTNEKLATIEKQIEKEMIQSIEFIEVKKKGLIVQVRYEKRREPIVLPEVKRTLVAKKEGIIKSILVEHGQKMVEVNDYVTKGSVLISDSIVINDQKTETIFAKGIVMAYTWNIVELSVETLKRQEAEAFNYLIMECDKLALKDSDQGSISERNVLDFKYNEKISSIKIHYQVLENIAIEADS